MKKYEAHEAFNNDLSIETPFDEDLQAIDNHFDHPEADPGFAACRVVFIGRDEKDNSVHLYEIHGYDGERSEMTVKSD